jgi:hypothetical protein
MATHYLIDAHTTTLLSSEINDVRYPQDGRSEVPGSFVVVVPDGIKLSASPTDLQDLLDKKYEALLAEYPGYTNIVYDDCLDATGYTVSLNDRAKLGFRGGIGVGSSARVTTPIAPLGATVSQYILLVEANRWVLSYDSEGRLHRTFEEDFTTDLGLQVSTNGGSDYTNAVNGQLNQITIGDEGTDLRVRFEPSFSDNSTPVYITSWAVIY